MESNATGQENQVGLKVNGSHQLLVYADVNLLEDKIDIIKKNIETLIDGNRDVGLEVNADIKFMLLSHHQNAGQNQDIKIANRSFENVGQFKYLGTNQNLIQVEIKRLNRVMIATIQSKTFCLLVCCLKT
jgi:hypothetical protein